MIARASSRFAICARYPALALLLFAAFPAAGLADNQEAVCARLLKIAEDNSRLQLARSEIEDSNTVLVHGTYRVFENREEATGREIELSLIVLPAQGDDPAADPVFVLHGGPGAAATTLASGLLNSWIRERRDIVLVDQRGTGNSNPLHIPNVNRDDDLQSYLDPMFQLDDFKAALPELQKVADLTQYTTLIAMDDLNEIREVLGYDRINLRGGSYGSRAALEYMRRHPETVRTATIEGIAPVAMRNPLTHARAAQDTIDLIFEECEGSERYREAFPDVKKKFWEVIERLEEKPAQVTLKRADTGDDVTVTLTRTAFAESIRILMYSTATSRRIPNLILEAHAGDYRGIASAGIVHSRRLRGLIASGMLMCVIGSEDISRIDPAEIEPACAGTFLGSSRMHEQYAVAQLWPKGKVPANYGEPVSVDVPTLLFSGTLDPVTPPMWGNEAASHLPNSLHVIVPGGHGVGGAAVDHLQQEFLESGSTKGLDTSEVKKMRLPPFELPARAR